MRCQYYKSCEIKTPLEYEMFCNKHFKLCPEYKSMEKTKLSIENYFKQIRQNEGIDLLEMVK